MLIPATDIPGLPRCWEHVPSSPAGHGGVAETPTGGYVATIRHDDGSMEHRRFTSLPDAEEWLAREINADHAPTAAAFTETTAWRM